MGRVVILTLITVAIIFFIHKRDKDTKKTIISLALFGYILLIGYSGFILTRTIKILFFIDILTLIISYFALIYYIFTNKLMWYIFTLPLLCIAIYFGLNYLEGSRYEP